MQKAKYFQLYLERLRLDRATFGEGNYMVILEAETALAVAEPLADDVSRRVLAPPLRVPPRYDIGLRPTLALRLGVEEPRPLLSAIVAAARTAGRGLRV